MLKLRLGLFVFPVQLVIAHPVGAQDLGDIFGNLIRGAVQADIYRQQQDALQRQRRWAPRSPAPVILPGPTSGGDQHTSPEDARYVVDGHILGQPIEPKQLPKEFTCTSSDQFVGSRWCLGRISVRGVPIATALLISPAGKLAYHSKAYEKADFASGDIVDEIDRLSNRYHARPRIFRMPANGSGEGVIALWGAVTLEPVDGSSRAKLAGGSHVDLGILVDFLSNARESAKRGLPVFSLGGGAGYFWVAKVDRDGHGSLRFGISDVAALSDPPIALQAPGVAAVPSTTPPQTKGTGDGAAVQARQEALDRLTAEAKRVLDEASGFVKAEPTDLGVLDLVQAISNLGTAVGNHDADVIGKRMTTLKVALGRAPRFAAYQRQREEDLGRRSAQAVSDALRTAREYRGFLAATVIADPTSSDAATFLPLIKRIDAAVSAPQLERLQAVDAALDLAIRQAGLQDRYARYKATTDAVAGSTDKAPPATSGVETRSAVQGQRWPDTAKHDAGGETERRQAALRTENAKEAEAAANKLNDEIKQYVTQPSEAAILVQEFPQFFDWLDGEKTDGWTLKGGNFELKDYGSVDWEGRSLSVPMTKVTFHLDNPARGDTKDTCFVFGRIDDPASNATRDPIAVECGDAATLNRWRTAHAFTSRWVVD